MLVFFKGKRICRSALFAFVTSILISSAAIAAEEQFVVRDIRVQGLQRISEGAVFNYLPINIGDTIGREEVQEALRAIYSTEFFNDVELAATHYSKYGMSYENVNIFICKDPKMPLKEIWEKIKHFI